MDKNNTPKVALRWTTTRKREARSTKDKMTKDGDMRSFKLWSSREARLRPQQMTGLGGRTLL